MNRFEQQLAKAFQALNEMQDESLHLKHELQLAKAFQALNEMQDEFLHLKHELRDVTAEMERLRYLNYGTERRGVYKETLSNAAFDDTGLADAYANRRRGNRELFNHCVDDEMNELVMGKVAHGSGLFCTECYREVDEDTFDQLDGMCELCDRKHWKDAPKAERVLPYGEVAMCDLVTERRVGGGVLPRDYEVVAEGNKTDGRLVPFPELDNSIEVLSAVDRAIASLAKAKRRWQDDKAAYFDVVEWKWMRHNKPVLAIEEEYPR